MSGNQELELEVDEPFEAATESDSGKGPPAQWYGRLGKLESGDLRAFWAEAMAYARWEIGQYDCWRDQDEPVLASGYDAKGVVQAAFERLLSREVGNVPIVYSAEELRRELRALVKRRVRWLHERSETGRVVSEWDVLPPGADGQRVSVFDNMPGRIASPDQEAWEAEKQELLAEFKDGFEEALGKRRALLKVFRELWTGKKRREMVGRFGGRVSRVRALRAQLMRRLGRFAKDGAGGLAEVARGGGG